MVAAQVLSERARKKAARDLMEAFATATGLTSSAPPRRYLWTDAYAVCAFLGLHEALADRRYLYLALALVEQVHDVLGHYRPDDPRRGWLSGLSENEGRLHPTVGGLRIGKPRAERQPREPYDPGGEWDRDGQYYHYLTRWMHALQRVAQVSGDDRYHTWAVELARVATERFSVGEGKDASLYWKMSTDLSRPLVPSAGLHDPLDGLITLEALVVTAPGDGLWAQARLLPLVARLQAMCEGRSWVTDDPLGAGSLLVDVHRAMQIPRCAELCPRLTRDAVASLRLVEESRFWLQPPSHRLAFRELGLSIGLRAVGRVSDEGDDDLGSERWLHVTPDEERVLSEGRWLAERIEEFWLEPDHRASEGWSAHADISQVMLATSLLPRGYLG